MQQNIILKGKAREVFDALKAKVAEIEAKPKRNQIYRTTILAPDDVAWLRVPVVGRVPS